MKTNRVERHIIKKSHKMWKACDELCFKAKNLYNYANYIQRQRFINGEKIYKHTELDKMLQKEEVYKELGSQSSQRLLKRLELDWKSFLVAVKDYSKNPNKYLGKPKLPKYKKKDGRYVCELKNIQFKIIEGYVRFSLKKLKQYNCLIKSNVKDKVMGIRIIPRGSVYILEIVYEKEINELKEETNRILGIDLGVDNIATCVNNIGIKPIVINGKVLKSINQYYNKKLAILKSDLKKRHNKDWSNKLDRLQRKRDNKVDYYLHCSSKKIIEHCIENNIDTIVVGLNKTWKQESNMNKKSNQNFISIPYDKFISQITYKAQDVGIKVITTEESYTSGCSFLDGEGIGKETYNKNRRVYRGLFVSNKGIKINADCNGAYNIIRKVVPNAFADGIEGVDLHPIRVNI